MRRKLTSIFLRVGLASVFLYAGVAAFIEPDAWIGFLVPITKTFFAAQVLLYIFSAYEIMLALWLLSGKKPFFSGALAALTFFMIIISNLGAFDVIFRDMSGLFAALALVTLSSGD